MDKNKKITLFLCISLISFVCLGCATIRNPVPQDLITKVTVDNMSEIRTFLGSTDSPLQRNLVASVQEERSTDYPVGADGVRVYPVLAISGGAANGAYGAGLLKGWSIEGSRPKFKIITGVSTGAITAPFAFLGEDYDQELEKIYTTLATKDVLIIKKPLRAFLGDSLSSNKPLEKQIKTMLSDEILQKIAAENKAGRRLYIGTTNLDAERFVVWDMGAIAARGDKELFCKVILASAAIPLLFPPVFINVKVEGQRYDELHLDGGTIAQAFTVYRLIDPLIEEVKASGFDLSKFKVKHYIIRNGYVAGSYAQVKDDLSSIASRALDTMINAQGVGDTYRIYAYMKKRNNDYNLAYIPSDFRPAKKEEFDPVQMKKLFDKGYQEALAGYKWHKAPPGLEGTD